MNGGGGGTSRRALASAAIAVTLLAACLRFLRLGDWTFYADEIIGFHEIDQFLGATGDVRGQMYRLPRLVPLGYLVMAAGDAVFGRSELGSRVLMAIIGTGSSLVLLLGLARPLGLPAAIASAVLVAVWPDHLYYSQLSRFYMPAAFFASLCMVLGARAMERRSTSLLVAAFAAGFAALASHTIQGATLAVLVIAGIAFARGRRADMPRHATTVAMLAMALAAAVLLLYLVPLGRGWNPRTNIGSGVSAHLLLATVNKIGFPVAMLAPLGAVALLQQRPAQGRYWIAFAAAPFALSLLLPLVVAYHPDYAFPSCTAVVVLSGYAIGSVFELLHARAPAAARVWFVVACLLNLPGVLSYFKDGNRHDFRTAARLMEPRVRPDDRLSGIDFLVLTHYSPSIARLRQVDLGSSGVEPLVQMREMTGQPGRVWFVFARGRAGLPEDLRAWLGRNCRHEIEVRNTRLDYRDWAVDVFLWDPAPDPEHGVGTTLGGDGHAARRD